MGSTYNYIYGIFMVYLWYISVGNKLFFCIDLLYDIQHGSGIIYPKYFKDPLFVKKTQKLNQLPIHETFIKQKS